MAIAKGQHTENLEQEIEELKTRLEERKVIERAKGILSRDLNISEEEAYKKLRRLSMDRRAKMSEISELIIMDSE